MIVLRKFLIVIIILVIGNIVQAITLNADIFSYDESKISEEFKDLDNLEKLLIENPGITLNEIVEHYPDFSYFLYKENYSPFGITEISAPGKIPSFWWAFSFSIIGSYTLYGAVAGPIAVGVVYFSTDKNKAESKKAIYGCVTGTVLGFGIRYLTANLL
ncbi:MAG: hypothetical protein ABFS35_04565 [Bacteroidota bacterium]